MTNTRFEELFEMLFPVCEVNTGKPKFCIAYDAVLITQICRAKTGNRILGKDDTRVLRILICKANTGKLLRAISMTQC